MTNLTKINDLSSKLKKKKKNNETKKRKEDKKKKCKTMLIKMFKSVSDWELVMAKRDNTFDNRISISN